MRCNDCNKFVGLDAGEYPEAELEIREKNTLCGTIKIGANCDACSTELLSHEFEIEKVFDEEQLKEVGNHCCDLECDAQLTTEARTILRKRFSDTQKDAEGKPKELKPEELEGWAVFGDVAIKCEKGDELFTIAIEEVIPQNEMDEQ